MATTLGAAEKKIPRFWLDGICGCGAVTLNFQTVPPSLFPTAGHVKLNPREMIGLRFNCVHGADTDICLV